ncbi:hypothetical protein J4E90_009738 [Alternaria incomplexa]|uniref:uncharacterized protein n=1 Tax=Alternaria incomplexa TaxID=1187928 RepID=UPI00221F3024|nr:uncharacterized protein J4E90_009738 [Alternaria incomplexa]KAI4907236.1 hypothetical protein J4E90_009738 [Alternaria incomplexa]
MDPTDVIIQLVVPSSVGETVCLNVHRGVLCKSSAFFKNAIKLEWATQEENVVNLPEDSANTVIDYIKWLYYDKIETQLEEASEDTREKKAVAAEKAYCLLADAYVFGEKIIDLQYKEAVMKAIFATLKSYNWNMGPESVNIIYEGTPPGSQLRRFIAERIAYEAFVDSDEGVGWLQYIEGYPRDVLVDALKVMVRVRPKLSADLCPSLDSYLEKA